MLAEQAVYNAIKHLAATYPGVAPKESPLPRIVYQQVGGAAVNYMEDTLPDADNARIQVACWATTPGAAANLSKQVDQALRGIQARPIGARISVHEPDTGLYGSMQDFNVWSKDEP